MELGRRREGILDLAYTRQIRWRRHSRPVERVKGCGDVDGVPAPEADETEERKARRRGGLRMDASVEKSPNRTVYRALSSSGSPLVGGNQRAERHLPIEAGPSPVPYQLMGRHLATQCDTRLSPLACSACRCRLPGKSLRRRVFLQAASWVAEGTQQVSCRVVLIAEALHPSITSKVSCCEFVEVRARCRFMRWPLHLTHCTPRLWTSSILNM